MRTLHVYTYIYNVWIVYISLATNLFSHFHSRFLNFKNADRLKVNMVKCFKIGKMFILWVVYIYLGTDDTCISAWNYKATDKCDE